MCGIMMLQGYIQLHDFIGLVCGYIPCASLEKE